MSRLLRKVDKKHRPPVFYYCLALIRLWTPIWSDSILRIRGKEIKEMERIEKVGKCGVHNAQKGDLELKVDLASINCKSLAK